MTHIETSADLAAWLQTRPPKHAVAEASLVTWLELLRDHRDLWWATAHRPEAPPEVLRVLALSEDEHVRGRVASRNKLPEDVRSLLSTDPQEVVRNAASRVDRMPPGAGGAV
jgi:hypothetical protein